MDVERWPVLGSETPAKTGHTRRSVLNFKSLEQLTRNVAHGCGR
jgi:hypothetical protein